MARHSERRPARRRFLAINFRVGSRENGYLVGPALVSTADFERFHFWDEAGAAVLGDDEYQIVKIYPRGLTYDEVTRRFNADFHPVAGSRHASGWCAPERGQPIEERCSQARSVLAA